MRYCGNTGSDLRHLHFHETHLAMARCDETKHVGPAGRCNRMPLTLPHEGASSEPGDPIRATFFDRPTHKSRRTAGCSNEGRTGDHTSLWLLAEARLEAIAELSLLLAIGHSSVSCSTVFWKPRAQDWMTDIAATAFWTRDGRVSPSGRRMRIMSSTTPHSFVIAPSRPRSRSRQEPILEWEHWIRCIELA